MNQPNRASLAALFLISAAALGFEVQLTRYFAIASWSEYGYWIISIVMVGLSVSGVVLSLFKDFFQRQGERFLNLTPLLLIPSAVLGFWAVTLIPFNPLEFQNHELWQGQLICVGQYYLALFPFFFLSGLYIGLNFVLYPQAISKVYAFDLLGGAVGSIGLVVLMNVVHPFFLLAVLLPLLGLSSWLRPSPKSWKIAALVVFIAGETGAFALNQADYCQYKGIYPPLHVEGNRVVEGRFSPRGLYEVLDNFTERLDVDLSNNYSLLKVNGPPTAYGLYQDGNRIESLPKTANIDTGYAKAALDILPYELRPEASVLLIGTRGGFKVPEIFFANAKQVTALEPDPILYRYISNPLYGGHWFSREGVALLNQNPQPYLKSSPRSFDIIDLSAEFLDQSPTNRLAFTQQALREDFIHLNPGGILSIPASIRELTVYALKNLESAREALQGLGIDHPEDHLLLYRSAWNTRLLVFKDPLTEKDLRQIKAFCSDRSFDISYYRGLTPGSQEVWNEIPPMPFGQTGRPPRSREPQDALRDDALRLFAEPDFKKNYFFDLTPSTNDKPFFHSVLRLSRLNDLWQQLALIPREEIGSLVNLAVLVQSALFAGLILGVPSLFLFRRSSGNSVGRFLLYFPALGLGFLFLEIYLIEKASFLLGDATLAFSLVLSGMLFFSGLGSWFCARYRDRPRQGLAWGLGLTLAWSVLALLFMDPLLTYWLPLSTLAKCVLLLLLTAPLSFGLGMPFVLGLGALEKQADALVPWAWALNGAFSVIATPLANLISLSGGFSRLLGMGLLLYVLVWLTFPRQSSQGGS